MTRKDYERLAAVLKERRASVNGGFSESERSAYDYACESVAVACKADNPLFNRARFLAACGVQS